MTKVRTLSKIIYSIITSVIILTLTLAIPNLFKIKFIETTARPYDFEGFPSLTGRYIFNIPENEIKKHFLKNPQVSHIVIKRKYPDGLVINVIYRNKIAKIVTENGIFILDNQGVIFQKVATESALPTIHLPYKNVDLGTNITQSKIKKALEIVEISNSKNLRFVDIIPIEDNTILMTLDQGTKVVIGTKSKAEDIVSSLQMILRRFTIEGKTVSKIDFRFDKIVITF